MRCGIKSRVLFAGLVSLVLLAPAQAQINALSSVGAVAGNQNFAGLLGQDFTVNSSVFLNSIGVFNAGATGTISSTLTAALYQLDGLGNGTLVANTLQTFGPSAGNTITAGSFIVKSLTGLGVGGSDIVLGPGKYTVVAFGFNAADQNYNSFGVSPSQINVNTGGVLTFSNIRWNNNPLAIPSSSDSTLNEPGRFGAATFGFTAVSSSAPEPASFGLVALGMGCLGVARRKRK